MAEETSDNTAAIHDHLRSLALKVDAGEIGREDPVPSSPTDGDLEQPVTDATKQPARDAKGKFAANQPADADKSTQEPNPQDDAKEEEAPKAAEKADSDFTKAKKESERRDRSWKKLQEEKAALDAERSALEKLRAEAAKPEPPKAAAAKDATGFTSAEYDAAAEDFEREGDLDLARAARAKAQAVRAEEWRRNSEQAHHEFSQSWEETCDALCKQKPELLDFQSPLSKTVTHLLGNEPLLSRIPDGFAKAVDIATLRLEADSVPGLKSQIETLGKQLEAANARLSIGGGNPAKPPAERSFRQLGSEEQERELRRMANEYDSAAA